jgi:hypothetical protein
VPPETPLSTAQVFAVIASRATERPLSTLDITDLCIAAHPAYPHITPYRVLKRLRYLNNRDRVVVLHATRDAQQLERLGVKDRQNRRWLYWTVPSTTRPASTPLAEHGVYDDLPTTDDGRQPFPVADERLDAPWGAVLELTDSGYPGWWQRHRDTWAPIERPGRRDT